MNSNMTMKWWKSVGTGIALAALGILGALPAYGATGVWTNRVSGSWSTAANWSNGIPDAADAVADFSTLNITADVRVTNDSPHTVGTLRFGDTTPNSDWFITTNSSLTLSTTVGLPTIFVSNQQANVGAVLHGTQGFVKSGAGQLNLDQSLPSNATSLNDYTGGTYIKSGTLMFGTYSKNYITNLLGTGTVYLGDDNGSDDATLQSAYGSYLLTNNIVMVSSNTGTMRIKNNSGSLTLSGTITLGTANGSGKGVTFGIVGTGVGVVLVSGSIQDPVGMTAGTAGTVTITTNETRFNGVNTYVGATVIEGSATLKANASTANNGGLPAISALTVNGTLEMVNHSFTIGSLSGTGKVDNSTTGTGSQTLTIGSNNNSTAFSGIITNSAGVTSLTKIGTGAQTLSGANWYSGMTTISNGTLVVSNNLALSTNTVILAGGCLGASTGTWAITNVVNVQADSSLGTNGTLILMGNLTNNGTLTVVSGGILINGSKTGTGALTVSGGYLGGTGTVAGVVTNYATVTAGDTNSVGTLTLSSNLVMNAYSTYEWNCNDTTNDVIVVGGALTVPAVATVNVNQVVSGKMPSSAVLFSFGSVNSSNLAQWVINGAAPSTRARIVGNQVKLVTPTGWLMFVQ